MGSTTKMNLPRHPVNVVFDLDNTLIYSIPYAKFPRKRTSHLHSKPHHVMDDEYVIFERPGLQEFLDYVFDHFNVSVWSAASPEYVEFIVEHVICTKPNRHVEYVLHSDNCEDCQDYYGEQHFKNLHYLWDVHDLPGYGPLNTLIVDDLGWVKKTQPHSCIQIKAFNTNHKQCWEDCEFAKTIQPKLDDLLKRFSKEVESPTFQLVPLDRVNS